MLKYATSLCTRTTTPSSISFYQTIFGMRRMTSNTLDETGKQNTGRGHISDGVIGLAILSRYAGMQSGMDHYGFEVERHQGISSGAWNNIIPKP